MSDVNQVVLIGRLVRDAELKCTSSGKPVTRFSLAVNEKRKVGDDWKDSAGFFEVVLWGQLGESLSLYLTKGKQIAVIGKLTQERWEQNGDNRSKVVVTASTVQLLGGSSNSDSKSNGGAANRKNNPPPSGSADDYADNIPW